MSKTIFNAVPVRTATLLLGSLELLLPLLAARWCGRLTG